MIDAYHTITQHCKNNNKDFSIRNHAYCLYIETLEQALNNSDNSTPKVIEATSSALLAEQAIEGYVTRAESFADDIIKSAITPLIHERKKADFWYSVTSSVLGSFIFTILLLLIFWVAKDQIYTWLLALKS